VTRFSTYAPRDHYPELSDKDAEVEGEILDGMARTLFLLAYADFVEREIEDGHDVDDLPRPGGGEDWDDLAPETPLSAREAATTASIQLCGQNGCALPELYRRATAACEDAGVTARRNHEKHTPEAFGSDLAMMVTGQGVSWFDDHARFPLDASLHFEFHVFDRAEAGLKEEP
jgi:hypothetical protein